MVRSEKIVHYEIVTCSACWLGLIHFFSTLTGLLPLRKEILQYFTVKLLLHLGSLKLDKSPEADSAPMEKFRFYHFAAAAITGVSSESLRLVMHAKNQVTYIPQEAR